MLFSVLSPSTSNIARLTNCWWQDSDRLRARSQRVIGSAYLSGLERIEACNQEIVNDCEKKAKHTESLGQINSGGESS